MRGGRPGAGFGHVALYAVDGLVIVAPPTGETVQFKAINVASVQAARRVPIPADP